MTTNVIILSGPVANYPLIELRESAAKVIADGGTVFQKFTCGGCGQRRTSMQPNALVPFCECTDCGHVTDVSASGCNYSIVKPIYGEEDQQ